MKNGIAYFALVHDNSGFSCPMCDLFYSGAICNMPHDYCKEAYGSFLQDYKYIGFERV